MRGHFIVLEGGEGSGKTSQMRMLEAAFQEAGLPAIVTREPGGSELAEAIRNLLFKQSTGETRDPATEALLLAAARRDHLERLIRPALRSGRHVLCDRFSASTQVYQGALDGVPTAWLSQLHGLAVGPFTPCISILLDIDADQAARRMEARGGKDWFDGESCQTHQRILDAYRALAAAAPYAWLVVDAAADAQTVHQAVLAGIRDRLGLAL